MARWMVMVGVVTFLAGLLFGYDQGVISGALPLIKDDLDLSTFASEVITSWVTLGALGGGLVAGALADKVGRRRAAILAGLLFAGGALLETVAPGAALLTVGRVVTGVAVGFASTVAPLYAAEMAPRVARRTVRVGLPAGDHGRHLLRLPGRRRADVVGPSHDTIAVGVRIQNHLAGGSRIHRMVTCSSLPSDAT